MTSRNSSSVFEETLVMQHQQDSHYRFTLELGLFMVFLFGSFIVSINDLHYNTLFLDEAINAVIGKDFWMGIYSRNAMSFHFGSYLYPAISAIINDIGGVAALRLASAVLMSLTTIFIYFTTRKLFGRNASLFSMMLFSFSGIILNLSQLAVYDSLALPFLAASLFFLVEASTLHQHQKLLILASSSCAIIATLSKYICVIYLPALIVTTLALYWLKGTSVRQASRILFKYFVLPIVQVLSVYIAFYWDELIQLVQEQGFSPAPQSLILKIIGQEIGFIVFLALAGLVMLVFDFIHNRNDALPLLNWNEESQPHWYKLSRTSHISFFALILILLFTWSAAPLQQLLNANIRSLWKNCAYSLIFLSPLAGYGVTIFIRSLRSHNLAINVIGLLVVCTATYHFANNALDTNWSFHRSWPNTEGAMVYIRKAGLDENSRILAEEMDVYQYYFASEIDNRQIWNNFWYMEYEGETGTEGAFAAIRDGALDFIIIDDYYFPGLRELAAPILAQAGYVVGWQEEQRLRTGETILLQVFIPGNEGAQ